MVRFIKFCCVGGIGMFIAMGQLYLYTELLGLFYMLSAVITGIVGISFSYGMHNYWTFKDRKNRNMLEGSGKFTIVTLIYYGYYYLFLYVLTSIVGWYYLISFVIITVLGFVLKYILSFAWVWKEKKCEY